MSRTEHGTWLLVLALECVFAWETISFNDNFGMGPQFARVSVGVIHDVSPSSEHNYLVVMTGRGQVCAEYDVLTFQKPFRDDGTPFGWRRYSLRIGSYRWKYEGEP